MHRQSTLRIDQNNSSNALAKRLILGYGGHNGENFNELLVFGPNYVAKETEFWRQEKEKALRHVLEKSECSNEELKAAMRCIERNARAAYADDILNNMIEDFPDMMAKDGCFFLLLAFSILGAGPELKFPEKHFVFGVGCATENMTRWLKSIFLVGNQVPFVVLEKLMELRFFQELKRAEKQWKQPSEKLAKGALHKFLMSGQNLYVVDLIHCLQSIMLGTEIGSVQAIPEMLPDRQGIPSALQLSQRGVQFEKLEGELGIRSIHYQHSNFNSVLHLPVLMVDRHTDLMVECLIKYEVVRYWRAKIEPETISYLELLKDLIRTTDDLEILSTCGIIQGQPKRLRKLLDDLEFSQTSAHLYQIRQQINQHRPLPWWNSIKLMFKVIWTVPACLMLIFTYLQVHYTILTYYHNVH